ncbi:hypothetical protein [Streptomyces sp. CoH27]|uniref:hypothetical protein n=1 Tax=Streptomyces sp. CoH27 TaxID=2875763 RepID=UPI001CD53002|nr:hypothetical protein [Streptomyces sp. CoH27]
MSVLPIEVACDESGSEGEKLVGGNTDVFCHASVRLTAAEAADCVRELRALIRSPAVEYKSGHLLREKNRHALEWFLGPAGPVGGRANAYLVDKRWLLLLALARRLLDTPPFADDADVAGLGAQGVASALYRASRATVRPGLWTRFLTVLNDLMRFGAAGDAVSTSDLVELAEELRRIEPLAAVDGLLGVFDRHRAGLDAFLRTRRRPDPLLPLALDPLSPAILRAIEHWSADGAPVSIVHDRHVTLTEARMARIAEFHTVSGLGGRLSAIRLVTSGADPRVQVADYLAGVARKLASDELLGTADPALTGLVRQHVDPRSIWGDAESRARVCRPV